MRLHSSRVAPLALTAISILLTIVVLEGGARLLYYVRWNGHLYKLDPIEYSPRLGWQLATGRYREFTINAQGFRHSSDVDLTPPANTVRIFVAGGSTAFGTNGLYPQIPATPLSSKDTIDSHLQDLLNARLRGGAYEVINAGVPEYRLFQEITLLREKLLSFTPQIVVFLDGHNDISFLTPGLVLAHSAAPYWNNRHFQRLARVMNSSSALGSLYWLDIFFGRVSYVYHGLSVLFQRTADWTAVTDRDAWGTGVFRPEDEAQLKQVYAAQLREVDEVLPLYLAQIADLRAIAASRGIKVIYALQPEIVVEPTSSLTPTEARVQNLAFRHHRDLGTLKWRYLSSKIANYLEGLNDENFRTVNLVSIAAANHSEDLYTDYCHLTSAGNLLVARRLYSEVVKSLDRTR
jgi:hypothetical protein